MNNNPIVIGLLSFAGGLGTGVVLAVLLIERAQNRMAAALRTGRPTAPEPGQQKMRGVPSTAEASAERAISQASIETGADTLQEVAKMRGGFLSRKDALRDAEAMLRADGPMGGVV